MTFSHKFNHNICCYNRWYDTHNTPFYLWVLFGIQDKTITLTHNIINPVIITKILIIRAYDTGFSRFPARVNAGSTHVAPPPSPPSPSNHLKGIPVAPPRSGRKSDKFAVLLQGGGGGIPPSSQDSAVMCLSVGRKQHRLQVHSTVWELHPQLMVGPVGEAPSHHPSLVGCLRLGSNRAEGVEEHPDCLPKIVTDTHPVKQPGDGVERPLHPIRFNRCDHGIVYIE